MVKKFAKKIRNIFSCLGPQESNSNKTTAPLRPLRRKMVIVGDGECGKTCLVIRMCTGDFVDVGYLPTVFETEVVSVNTGKELVDLTIFDTAGQEDYNRLRPFSYYDVDVAIICFNLADTDTLTNVTEKWSPEVRYYCGNVPILLVGNKKDLRDPPGLTFKTFSSQVPESVRVPSIPEDDGSEVKVAAFCNSDEDDDKNDTINNGNEDADHCNVCSSEDVDKENRMRCLIAPTLTSSTAHMPFHVQAPVKHSEGTLAAKRIGAIAYLETSALTGDNVEELLLATTKAAVLGSRKSKTFKPFMGTLKSWKSVNRLEQLSKKVV